MRQTDRQTERQTDSDVYLKGTQLEKLFASRRLLYDISGESGITD